MNYKEGQVVLSKRLQMLADMVSKGNRLVDVGCDHGFLSIYLVQQETCPGALAMDVRKGPLAAATAHVQECGLEDYIETRLSDGLLAYNAGEAETLVCAGMGGPLMEKILTDSFEKVKQLKELILQPQSEIAEFRRFLRENNFVVIHEDAVIDDGKYYFAMKARWAGEECANVSTWEGCSGVLDMPMGQADANMDVQKLYDAYGEKLLQGKHPVLLDFLKQRQTYLGQLRGQLMDSDSEKAKLRLPQIDRELAEISAALLYY